jgi:hypothetical protein
MSVRWLFFRKPNNQKGDVIAMRHYRSVLCLMVWILVAGVVSAAADARPVDLETILKGIETRYAGKGFSAAFFQESMLKAMQISYT